MRKSRVVWSGPDCLLQQPTAALLSHLANTGHAVSIIGASVTTGRPNAALERFRKQTSEAEGKVVTVPDDNLAHQLIRTASSSRDDMTNKEQNLWYKLYMLLLNRTRPDLVLTEGDRILERFAMQEARMRGIPCAAIVPPGTVSTLPVDVQLEAPVTTNALIKELTPLLSRQAGDANHQATLQASHRLLGNGS